MKSQSRYQVLKGRGELMDGRTVAAVLISLTCLWGCGDELTRDNPLATDDVIDTTDSVTTHSDTMGGVHEDIDESKMSCTTDSDCQMVGHWRRCITGECQIDVSTRSLRIHQMEVQEPAAIGPVLDAALGEAIRTGDLNLLVHMNEGMTWLIQGIESGRLNGAHTFGQSENLGSYCDESQWRCEGDLCRSDFTPDSEHHRIRWRIPLPDSEGGLADGCTSQFLELVDVHIALEVHLPKRSDTDTLVPPRLHIEMTARLMADTADQFVVTDGATLMDMIPPPHGDENNRENADDSRAWPIKILAIASPTVFDNDHGPAIDGIAQDMGDDEDLLDIQCL